MLKKLRDQIFLLNIESPKSGFCNKVKEVVETVCSCTPSKCAPTKAVASIEEKSLFSFKNLFRLLLVIGIIMTFIHQFYLVCQVF